MASFDGSAIDCTGGGVCTLPMEDEFMGRSEPFEAIRKAIRMIASRNSYVTILGQTGTGKEIVARQVHLNSNRCKNRFLPVNCSGLTSELFESQLFGHVKGAFTGANTDTLGIFRAADGGTLFLDEIGEIDLHLQAKLLRVLQDKCVQPVGSTEYYPVDVRVICATNRDLKQMVRDKTFRADLYFRLNVVQLHVPSLCERKKDILLLADYFLKKQAELYGEPYKALSENAKQFLLSYNWPGNVRELANVIEHMYITSPGSVIDLLSPPASVFNEPIDLKNESTVESLDEINKRAIIDALNRSEGQSVQAAKRLQITYRKLISLVDKYSIHAHRSS